MFVLSRERPLGNDFLRRETKLIEFDRTVFPAEVLNNLQKRLRRAPRSTPPHHQKNEREKNRRPQSGSPCGAAVAGSVDDRQMKMLVHSPKA